MSKNKKEEEPPPPPPPPKETEDEKIWDKVAYNVVFDMIKGVALGVVATLLVASKKAAFASGVGFGAGQSYADFLMEFKYNAEIREKEKEKKAKEEEEEQKKKEEAEKEAEEKKGKKS